MYTTSAEKSRGGMERVYLSTEVIFDTGCLNDTIDGAHRVVGHPLPSILYIDLLEHAMSNLSK